MLSLMKAIFSLHTFLRRSLKKPTVRNFARATPIPEAEWCIPGIIAHWIGLVVDTRVHSTKRTVG